MAIVWEPVVGDARGIGMVGTAEAIGTLTGLDSGVVAVGTGIGNPVVA